jgi:hypothetical protein
MRMAGPEEREENSERASAFCLLAPFPLGPFSFLRPSHQHFARGWSEKLFFLLFYFLSHFNTSFFFRKKKSEFDHGFKATGLTRQIGSLIAKVFQFKLTNFSAD